MVLVIKIVRGGGSEKLRLPSAYGEGWKRVLPFASRGVRAGATPAPPRRAGRRDHLDHPDHNDQRDVLITQTLSLEISE